MDPPALLDPVLTTMSSYYQVPECLDPLDADPDKDGKKSDHRIVVARAISEFNNKSARKTKEVKVRPIPESGILKMKKWFVDQSWKEVYRADSSHDKAAIFQKLLLEALDEFFPEKVRKISNDDQPWISHRLKVLDRKRKRLYRKERRSEKWKTMDKFFKKEVKSEKAKFYQKTVEDLKTKNPGQWYSCLKKITSYDQKGDRITIDEISHLSDQNQAEKIADKFTSIPNEFEELKTEDISFPPFLPEEIPLIAPSRVWLQLTQLKINKATVQGDFPPKLTKMFAAYLAEPLADIINTSIRRGEYPKLYKYEISTPVPKSYPVRNTAEIRNISGLLTFDKIAEARLAELMISDMKPNMDKQQYGNQKGISIQHYLIEMINRILTALDGNSRATHLL